MAKQNQVREWPSINSYTPAPTIEIDKPRKKIFTGEWHVEEKIDGSQLTFKLESNGNITFRNRSHFFGDSLLPMYSNAILAITAIKKNLNPDFVYHGEAICKLRQNQLQYKRFPKKFFVLFEVEDIINGRFLNYDEKAKEAQRLEIEVSPCWFIGKESKDEEQINILLQKIEDGKIESLLGGKPEGMVIKNYKTGSVWPSFLKVVRQEFKEIQASKKEFGTKINTPEELIEMLGSQFAVKARYQKAVQHLRESEGLSDSKKDLGPLIKELDKDLLKEYREDISAALLAFFFPKIAARGREDFVEWYEKELENSKGKDEIQ